MTKNKIQIYDIPPDLMEAFDLFCKKNRLVSRSKAALMLIEKGLFGGKNELNK